MSWIDLFQVAINNINLRPESFLIVCQNSNLCKAKNDFHVQKKVVTSSSGRSLYWGSRRRSANSMYEQGTDSVTSSENWKETESATVELCRRRPSGLTDDKEMKIWIVNHAWKNNHWKQTHLVLSKTELSAVNINMKNPTSINGKRKFTHQRLHNS